MIDFFILDFVRCQLRVFESLKNHNVSTDNSNKILNIKIDLWEVSYEEINYFEINNNGRFVYFLYQGNSLLDIFH